MNTEEKHIFKPIFGNINIWGFMEYLDFKYIYIIDDVIREINTRKAIGWDLIHPKAIKDE
jgi:hypothetical protein